MEVRPAEVRHDAVAARLYRAGVLRWEYPVELSVARMLDACVESKSMLEVVVGVDGKERNVR